MIGQPFFPLPQPKILPGAQCGDFQTGGAALLASHSPIDGSRLGEVAMAEGSALPIISQRQRRAFEQWRLVPAPKRGALVKAIGTTVAAHKEALAHLITMECGKTVQEALGEVQEIIDMAEFAVGLSRQLYGKTIVSERRAHRILEVWQPLGPIAILTAFNFPMAVWGWNALLALVCGNSFVWKPSCKTPLCALALYQLLQPLMVAHQQPDLFGLLIGTDEAIARPLVDDPTYPLISATGSCAMGQAVGAKVAQRFGRSLLELGGNNAVIVCQDANLELASQAIVFGAVGTAGQRCTSTRRVLVHEQVAKPLLRLLEQHYRQLIIGDPRLPQTQVGPLIDGQACKAFAQALGQVPLGGGTLLWGGEPRTDLRHLSEHFVQPAVAWVPPEHPLLQQEIFAPLLLVHSFQELSQAIAANNSVQQGLSSAIFTRDLHQSEWFLGPAGSDCGLSNVNLGTSGAEIGGAFGGEKHTGGGREAGSDAWKAYMRRQTQTIHSSDHLELAQGVRFAGES